MDSQFVKRFKSFLWRTLCVALIAGLNWVLSNIGLLDLPVIVQGLSGLALGEVTKWLNNNTGLFGARLK